MPLSSGAPDPGRSSSLSDYQNELFFVARLVVLIATVIVCITIMK